MLIREEKRGDVTAELSEKVVKKLRREFSLVAQEVRVDAGYRVDRCPRCGAEVVKCDE